jgi:hypothetical protein
LRLILHDRRNIRENQRTPLLEAMENVSDNLVKFLPGKSWRTTCMFGFIASNPIPGPMIVDCIALGIIYLGSELEWNARPVFLAQNPTCLEALLAERCCRYNNLILLRAFDDFGVSHDIHILPECAGQPSYFNKRKGKSPHQRKVPCDASRNRSRSREKSMDHTLQSRLRPTTGRESYLMISESH